LWGGRGRGWVQGVHQVPFCSSLPGRPPRRAEQALPGSKGRGAKGRPGAWSQQPRGGWNPQGQGYPGRDHCLGGDQRGQGREIWIKAPSAAPAMVLGKGALSWGGRGRGWDRGGVQAPFRSSLPIHPPMGEVRTWEVGKRGGAVGGKGQAGWQPWKGKVARSQGVGDGDHTFTTSNYWGPLQARRPQAVRPGGQGVRGAEEDAPVPIRNGLSSTKGRNPAPSRQAMLWSHVTFWLLVRSF
jgi:hypothetical protein